MYSLYQHTSNLCLTKLLKSYKIIIKSIKIKLDNKSFKCLVFCIRFNIIKKASP